MDDSASITCPTIAESETLNLPSAGQSNGTGWMAMLPVFRMLIDSPQNLDETGPTSEFEHKRPRSALVLPLQ